MILFLLSPVFLADGVEPEPSFTDLVANAAEWHGRLEPNFTVAVSSKTQGLPPFPRWLPGSGGTRLEFRFHLDKPTTFVAQIARANSPAFARLELDGNQASGLKITTATFVGDVIDAKEGPLGSVDQDLWTAVPAGDHTVTISNPGSGWIEIPAVRIGGLGPTTFHMERKAERTVEILEVVKMFAPNISMNWWGVGVGAFPSDDAQAVRKLNITALDDDYKVGKVLDRAGQEFFLLRAPGAPSNSKTITVQVEATVTLYSRKLRPGAPRQYRC